MKFFERLEHKARLSGDDVIVMLDAQRELVVQVLEEKVFRLFVRHADRATGFRFDRTWAIANGADDVPFAGHRRSEVAKLFSRAPFKLNETANGDVEVVCGRTRLLLHADPFYLEWFFENKLVLQERPTGNLALSRHDERVWHFHSLSEDAEIFGLGETSGIINKRGRHFELRNVDAMGYDAEKTDPLYKHFPFLIYRSKKSSVGLFYDNFSTTTFDLGLEFDNYHAPYFSYRASSGDFDCYVMLGPQVRDVVRSFTKLTGRPMMPPEWSLGYSGSTMTYTDAPNAQEQLEGFLEKIKSEKIPCQSFHLSSGYTSIGEKRYVFNWNKGKIPDPSALVKKFNADGVHLIPNIKPVLLDDHPLYAEATKAKLFIADSEKDRPERSQFWGGMGSHLDFTNPQTREFWKSNIKQKLLSLGIDAVWNDNNEFEVWDDQAKCFGEGVAWPIQYGRSIQTLLMAMTSRAALKEYSPNEPAFVVSRSGMPGMQRYVQTWSGDNRTEWKTLRYNLAMALSLGLSGVGNTGHDIGGFSGPLPTPELFLRWIQHGIFYPRFVIHSWKPGGQVNEPWMYPELLPLVREAFALREKLKPYFLSTLKQMHEDFEPFLRPLFYDFESDPRVFDFPDQFMVGSSLLVANIMDPGQNEIDVYLPQNKVGWTDFHSGRKLNSGETVRVAVSLDSIPLFVQTGHDVPNR